METWPLLPDRFEFQRVFAAALDRPATGAMAVYRNTVLHGAVEALRANYPAVEEIVGPEMFEALAVDFAAECPPRRPALALYGAQFADWLSRQSWVEDLPYLPDVARVERLRAESLMAADAEPLQACSWSFRDVQQGVVPLHPALRFAWLKTPAMTIWLAHQQPFAAELAPEWKAEGALFARPSPFVVHALRIGPAAHRMLSGMRVGESVAASMAAATRLYPDENCQAIFASLLNLGVFVAPATEGLHYD
jgi:hypothetical protein